MADFIPQTFDINSINGGKRFEESDGITPSAINAPIEAAALLQYLAINSPDYSKADQVGNPTVKIENNRFVFENLKGVQGERGMQGERGEKGEQGERGIRGEKGDRGDSGLAYGASISNEYGESDTDGYTKNAVNNLFSNPNLLINGDFRINQRGKNLYDYQEYTADMWFQFGSLYVRIIDGGGIGIRFNAESELSHFTRLLIQALPYNSISIGNILTMSVSVNNIIYQKTFTVTDESVTLNIPNLGYIRFTKYKNTYAIGIVDNDENNPNHKENIINWVKLEYSKYATPYVPRMYEQELSLCRNYYQVYQQITLRANMIDGNTVKFSFNHKPFLLPNHTYSFTAPSLVDLYGKELKFSMSNMSIQDNKDYCEVEISTDESPTDCIFSIRALGLDASFYDFN